METIDPSTGQALPAGSIQRILFIHPLLHVYQPPPLTSTKGHSAATWTTEIFMCRLRVLETAVPNTSNPSSTPTTESEETVKIDILLEDPKTGDLFAAAPYTSPAAVEQAIDSSRFFAVRVVSPDGGKKVTLGIGFEERSDAVDFNIALQEARKVLNLDAQPAAAGRRGGAAQELERQKEEKRDFSLKEGETITVNIGGRGNRRREGGGSRAESGSGAGAGGAAMPFLPPPPSAQEVKAERRRSRGLDKEKEKAQPSAQDLGFDDGEFGEFQ
ncbi:DUF1681-domain-containing protein [Saccharata proteae CBS 121410]|uniref:DUF1681-domain-containing protein n=1 Tax=Saccharata proteae CBS 121410 TaxID=1314787 RepID=A0A9P4HKZ1_9PEZI|nr:DUF1681-domain-containing protein [Saccharata proteae CBS 121410]